MLQWRLRYLRTGLQLYDDSVFGDAIHADQWCNCIVKRTQLGELGNFHL
jgi:hypothetical protein